MDALNSNIEKKSLLDMLALLLLFYVGQARPGRLPSGEDGGLGAKPPLFFYILGDIFSR